ncbi:MAG: cell division protein FtsL, partial [Stellaceae bacterium]
MIKLATLFWLVLVTATGLAMFAVKYQVQALDDRLSDTKKAVTAQDREFRVLSAEWAYLNRPAALADMNRRFLSLAPIATKQLHSGVADIAMRPPPPPPPPPEPPPEPLVAGAAPSNAAPNNAIANIAVADSAGADKAAADNAARVAEARLPGSGLRVTP